MCTAAVYYTRDHYFGRNLDLEYSYSETVTVTPRKFPLRFRKAGCLEEHYAMIGMAYVLENYPLYYDASNEKGLSMAGLYFPGNAFFSEKGEEGKDAIATFEFLPWILGQCQNVAEARALLQRICLVRESFAKELPVQPLHWMIADQKEAIVVENRQDGLHVYDNPAGVLTNNPPFDYQMFQLNEYMSLTSKAPAKTFGRGIPLEEYSKGLGAKGLPGDLSSTSRFVKAAFTRLNSVSGESEEESVSQFFHILGSVDQQRGVVDLGNGAYETTIYSSCCNMDRGIYYYRTYDNSQISAVQMHKENLDGTELISYPLIKEQQIHYQNG